MTGQETEETARSQGAEEAEKDLACAGGEGKGLAFYLEYKKSSPDLKTPVENMVELNIKSYNRARTEWQPETYLV